MRHGPGREWVTGVFAITFLGLILGCNGSATRVEPQRQGHTVSGATAAGETARVEEESPFVNRALRHASELTHAISRADLSRSSDEESWFPVDRGEDATSPPLGPAPEGGAEVRWIESDPPAAVTEAPIIIADPEPIWVVSPVGAEADESVPVEEPVERTEEMAGDAVVAVSEAEENFDASQSGGSQPPESQPEDAESLVNRLRDAVRAGPGSPLSKATISVGLGVFDPARPMDEKDLDTLDPGQRQQVLRYHRLMVGLGRVLQAKDESLDRDAVLAELDQPAWEEPIRIRQVELCRRVRGYGVYDPFEDRRFLAGREHPVIVYCELDHFRTESPAEGGHRVRLSQEVVLYNELGSLEVWREPPVEIEDESRNRRRDFFVVQLVRIPGTLGSGRFRLKISVTDLISQSTDERVVPIEMVADHAMVDGGFK